MSGLEVEVVRSPAAAFLARETRMFDFIAVDLHGNDEAVWRRLWPLLKPRLSREGAMVLYNSHLWKIDEFRGETGLRWVLDNCLADFAIEVFEDPPPGMIVCRYR